MDAAADLRDEATRSNERRLLVLAGSPGDTRDRAAPALAAARIDEEGVTSVGHAERLPGTRLAPERSGELLGTTRTAVVVDCHAATRPNVLGRAAGAVDGGGLLILLAPPLADWPQRRDGFDDTLAVPPFPVEDVTGHFRTWLVRTLEQHPGVAIVAVENDDHRVVRDGRTGARRRSLRSRPPPPADPVFPEATYEACRTADQVRAVTAFESLVADGGVAVLESDRGRGKSSAAGLAAAAHAVDGRDVLVTAPGRENAAECFERARELLGAVGALRDAVGPGAGRDLETDSGRIRFVRPTQAAKLPDDPDLVIVDEAAALPVHFLSAVLAAPAVAYATTVHGYEGAGRGFSVRFRSRLERLERPVTTVRLDEPIRYAPGDPVEVWSFRALVLDAGPAADEAVADVVPGETTYERLTPEQLLDDEALLREAFGLLVLAHYRTEPDDLARLLDAPNVTVRALVADERVVSVALLAREGGLDADRRARMYGGHRVRGNMLPDVLTSQLRDEAAAAPVGQRIMRIATHPAVRSRGLGSHLLEGIRDEVAADVDWLGVGYGATPTLLDFWRKNGFRSVHLSTSRNDLSGEHSAIMLQPTSADGRALLRRHTDWFLERVPDVLPDALSDVDPDVIRGALRTVDRRPALDLTSAEWRVAAGMPHGAAIYETAPRPTRRLALRHLVDPQSGVLSDHEERLLVVKALQARTWSAVVDALGFPSHATAMRALGDATGELVAAYGTDAARTELDRFD